MVATVPRTFYGHRERNDEIPLIEYRQGLNQTPRMDLFKRLRREYEHGVGTINRERSLSRMARRSSHSATSTVRLAPTMLGVEEITRLPRIGCLLRDAGSAYRVAMPRSSRFRHMTASVAQTGCQHL